MNSLQYLSLLPSSKTLFPDNKNYSFPKSLSIPTSINLLHHTPSSQISTKVALSPDLLLDLDDNDDGLSNFINQEFDHDLFSPEFKLFVGNLPFHVDDTSLTRLFQQSGNVDMVEVVFDKLNRRSRGFGFVKMSSSREAEAAAKKFDGYELDGRQLRVKYGPPPRKKTLIKVSRDNEISDNNTTNTVYVGNLSWSVDNEALETLFWEHGNVMQAKVYYDKATGKSRGFGFVTYSSPSEVYSAVESLDGVDLDGRNIRVSVAVPLQRHQI